MSRVESRIDLYQKDLVSKFISLAKEQGYEICKPKLRRQKTSSKERTLNNDGGVDVVTRTSFRRPELDAYDSIEDALKNWRNYRGEFLLQSEQKSYLLATDHQIIGPFHPADDPVFLNFICVGGVSLLLPDFDNKAEKKWLVESRGKVPKPSYERFQNAHIENGVEGLLVEILDYGDTVVTLNSEDDLLKKFAAPLKNR